MSVWQPIETAPKDGRKVDLWTFNGRETDCWWDGEKNRWMQWGLGGFDTMAEIALQDRPTHWMPIPDGPK